MAQYTVTLSKWGENPYGWQVRLDGKVIDTYAHAELAKAYASYMNARETQERED